MSVLSSLAIKAGIKGLGMAANAAGSVVSAASGVARGIAGGVKNIGDAAANYQDGQDGTGKVINNVGIAGTAGAQKIKTGGGTLPAPKKTAKPAYNEKMPTEKLLAVAVKYLASIDATLKTQLENDRVAYQKQAQAQREAAVENKDSTFKKLGDKLGGDWMDKKPSGDMAKKLLVGGGLLAGLGAIGISKLDTAELDALKNNVELFKKDYGWLVDMGSFIGVGGFLGFLRGGVRGGLIGIVTEYVFEKLWYSSLNPMQPMDANGNPVKAPSSAGKGALMAGLGGFGLASAIKKIAPKIANAKQLGNIVKSTSIVEIQKAARRGTTWFATKRGRKFLIILGRKLGKGMMKKIGVILARIVGSVLLSGTGIGTIPGIISIIFNAGLLIYGIYDIAVSIWEAWNESQVDTASNENATPVAGETATGASAMATPSTGVVSKSETGRPEEAQAFFKGKGWTKEQSAGIVGNLFVESGLRTDAVGDGGQAYGIAQWHPDRQATFERVYGKPIRQSSFQEQLEYVNWELNNTEKAAGNALRGATTAQDAAAIVDKKYERSSGAAIAQRQENAAAIVGGNYADLKGGGGSGGGEQSFSAQSALEMGKKIFGKAGAALIGAQNYTSRPITEKINDPSGKILDMSRKMETAMIAGKEDKVTGPGPVASTAMQKSIMQASNDGSLGALDPNYPGDKDVVMAYLAHWKFAA